MTEADGLIVASIYKWVYQDLARAAGDFPVRYSHGFDIPKVPNKMRCPAIWTSTEFAARLKHNGFDLPLIAPGPKFMDSIPTNLKGRWTRTITLGGLRRHSMEDETLYWIKLAEMKDDRLPAQRTYIRDFVLTAENAGAPPETVCHITDKHMIIEAETRCVVLDGTVVSAVPYMILGEIWDANKNPWGENPAAKLFAQYVVDSMPLRTIPRAFTLDIAEIFDPDDPELASPSMHVVLEVNPIWSSAIYGADPAVALSAILAGVDYTYTSEWMWKPDPWLVQKAAAKIPMRKE